MQINHNINAMITQHALRNNNGAMSKSLERLSTGLKINRAQDDAAGLAMSEQMRTQIKGLGKAKQNSQDGIAALQIAEGGLAEITNIMQRQRELAIQAANDTLTSTERQYLDLEFQELTKEIARIAKTTDYNGKNMLNWSADPNLSFGAVGDKWVLQKEVQNEYDKIQSLMRGFSQADATITIAGSTTITIVGTAFNVALDALMALITVAGTRDTPLTPTAKDIDEIIANISKASNDLKSAKPAGLSPKGSLLYDELVERVRIIAENNAPPRTDSLANLFKDMILNDMTNAASYTLHIGPNYQSGMGSKWANEMTITYISLNPGSLGLSTKNIRTQNNSTEAIDHLEKIIKSVSGVRAKIGTYINRLEYTINNISSLEFNTQDAESRIRDTDFAQSTTEFTRNQILVQSATSMLAQANTLPQTALTLING